MTGNVTASPRIVGISEKGAQCVTTSSVDRPFWLPRASKVRWSAPPQVGQVVGAVIPGGWPRNIRNLATRRSSRRNEIVSVLIIHPQHKGTHQWPIAI